MATIKEMSKQETNSISGKWQRAIGMAWYVHGAMSALEEIEKAAKELSNTEDYSIIMRKIEQLKGLRP